MSAKKLQSHEICITAKGKPTVFSVDILGDGTHRLQVNLPDIRLTIDMSQHQHWALEAAINDAEGMEGRPGEGGEYGDE